MISNKKLIGLAPMDGYTDEPFRLLQCRLAKPDLIFTEFVNVNGLVTGGVKLYQQLLYSPVERPIIAQLFGQDPDAFYQAAIVICHLGFDGVDINMGCPAKKIVDNGSGAALIANPSLAGEIITAVKAGINDFHHQKRKLSDLKLKNKILQVINSNLKYSRFDLPPAQSKPTLSIKTRLGLDCSIINTWIPHLLSFSPDLITLHGRTLQQGYSGSADWRQIALAASMASGSDSKFLGNGDVNSISQASDYINRFGVDGVLIGRAAVGNPWVFSDHQPDILAKYQAMLLHAQIWLQLHPRQNLSHLRKTLLAYISGHPRAKDLRKKLVTVSSLQDLTDLKKDVLKC